MKNFISNPKGSILFSILIPLLVGCNPKPEPEKVNNKGDQETKVERLQISGKYHYLYCTKADFLALKERTGINLKNGKGLLLLKNNITDSGITLHGWTYKIADTVFSETPNIKFSVGNDTLTFQTGSYLGDFILAWKDIKEIRKQLKDNSNYKFVVFQPYYYNIGKTQVAYQIHFSEVPLSANVIPREKLIPSGKILNPIPPGGGNAFDE
jgi:hypothetical protein